MVLVPSLTRDSINRDFSSCASFSSFSISSIFPVSTPLALQNSHSCCPSRKDLEPAAYQQSKLSRGHTSWPQGYLEMLSGEHAELLPMEMLVSMLSELSRLSVSYAWSSSSARGPAPWGRWWWRMEWCTSRGKAAGKGGCPCRASHWDCASAAAFCLSSASRRFCSSITCRPVPWEDNNVKLNVTRSELHHGG